MGAFFAPQKTGLCGGSVTTHGLEALRCDRWPPAMAPPLQSLAHEPAIQELEKRAADCTHFALSVNGGYLVSVPGAGLRPRRSAQKPRVPIPSIGQTPTCGFGRLARSTVCFTPLAARIRLFFAVFPGAHARSCRHILQSRCKNAGFTAVAQSSGHTSPVALSGRDFENG
jgi:hypothetical protein